MRASAAEVLRSRCDRSRQNSGRTSTCTAHNPSAHRGLQAAHAHSVASAIRTARAPGEMDGNDSEQLRGFTLTHTRLRLDVDIAKKELAGAVELSITPTLPSLAEIRLNCRQCVVSSVLVNDIPATFSLRDPLASVYPSWHDPTSDPVVMAMARPTSGTVNPGPGGVGFYPEFRRRYVEALAHTDDDAELLVHIPKNIKLLEGDFSTAEGAAASMNFTELTVLITYSLTQPRAGVYFSHPDPVAAPHRFPYAYTHNQACGTRLWMPCVDTLWDKAPWRLEFVVPRQLSRTLPNGRGVETRETVVASVGEMVEQVVHPLDPEKKVVVYAMDEPAPTAGVMFAVGAFDVVRLKGWHGVGRAAGVAAGTAGGGGVSGVDQDGDEEMEEADEQAQIFDGSGGYAYFMGGRRKQVLCTTEFLSQALDFYVDAYITSKFPFPAYRLVFLEDTYNPIVTGSGISIVSTQFLVDDDNIDQVYETRKLLSRALAQQWFGNYIVPNSWLDIWIQVGFANFVSGLFLKKMFGNNEYRFRVRKEVERLAEIDIRQPPLAPTRQKMADGNAQSSQQQQQTKTKETVRDTIDPLLHVQYHPDDDWASSRAELLNTKAPLVVYMLDRRMGKGVLQKVLDHIIMNVRTRDMVEGLKTTHFHYLCRKISGRMEVEGFFKQWVYGAGTPRFSFLPKFNQRKMVIELMVKQTNPSFLAGTPGAVEMFSGPITVRVHEPLGIFDTDLSINGDQRVYELPYHSKYKRIKRIPAKKNTVDGGDDAEVPEKDGANEEDDDKTHYEWIRVDPENDWICLKSVGLQESSWTLQLHKDRDVVAQYDAILAFRSERYQNGILMMAVLIRQKAFFYRVRMEAAYALASYTAQIKHPCGLDQLMQLYRVLFCVPPTAGADEPFVVPARNDFDDFAEYFVRKALITSIGVARFGNGTTNLDAKRFLVDVLHFNDNTGNQFSDAAFMSTLCAAIGDIFVAKFEDLNGADEELFDRAVKELQYLQSVDRAIPSYQNAITCACLEAFSKWMLKGRIPVSFTPFLEYSRWAYCFLVHNARLLTLLNSSFKSYGNFQSVRMVALDAIILLDGLLASGVGQYLLAVVEGDPVPYIRYHTARSLLNWAAAMFATRAAKSSASANSSSVVPSFPAVIGTMLEPEDGGVRRDDLMEVPESSERAEQLFEEMKNHMGPNLWEYLNVGSDVDERIRRTALKICEYLFEPAIDVSPIAAPKIKAKLKMGGTGRSQRVKGSVRHEFLAIGTSVVQRLCNHPQSFPFRNPVVFPGYHEVIKQPMDLSTVEFKLINGEYANDLSLLADDIFLIFRNCYKFNPDTLPVSHSARVLHRYFQLDVLPDAAKALGVPMSFLPLNAVPMSPAREIGRTQEQNTAVLDTQPSRDQPLAPPELNFCRSLLLHISSQGSAAVFREPVDAVRLNIPTYHSIVKKPMDLATLGRNLENGQYATVDEFASDMRLIFSNAVLFNGPSHPISSNAETLRAMFEKDVADPAFRARSASIQIASSASGQAGLDTTSTHPVFVKDPMEFSPAERIARFAQLIDEKDAPKDAAISVETVDNLIRWFSSRPEFPEYKMVKSTIEHEGCTKIMNSLGKSKSADPFRQSVDPLVFPLYAEVIKNPMDIPMIRRKLQNQEYSGPREFKYDIELMLFNCFFFNAPNDKVHSAGQAFLKQFRKEWANQGLAAWEEGPRELLVDNPFDDEEMNKMHRTLLSMERSTLSEPFRHPVDPIRQGVPNYFQIIKRPMDLSTIRKRIQERAYQTVQDFVDDVELMFWNCFTFNQPATQTFKMGQTLYHEIFVVHLRINNLSASLKLIDQVGPSEGLPSEIRDSLREVLIRFMQESDARYFVGAVDAVHHPDYRLVVSQPIDLGLMKMKIQINAYQAIEELENDIFLMFDNSLRYNSGRHPQVVTATDNLRKIFQNKYRKQIHAARHALATVRPPPPVQFPQLPSAIGSSTMVTTTIVGSSNERKLKLKLYRPRDHLSENTRQSLTAIVEELSLDPNACYFVGPVNLLDYPDYSSVNPHPMDFSLIKEKLRTNAYSSIDNFLADIQLVFENCYRYNQRRFPIVYQAAKRLEQRFKSDFKEAIQALKRVESLKPPPSSERLDPSAPQTISSTQNIPQNMSPAQTQPRSDLNAPSEGEKINGNDAMSGIEASSPPARVEVATPESSNVSSQQTSTVKSEGVGRPIFKLKLQIKKPT
ncbi:Bromodomain-domain-containing protein [Gonapodya prolifera JEL478]|uniref:Transcription initiation factor TFIID subunit 2 n=1 Tax=Gonapodya prolifera (strain JEL478) TaxID=1344416 RepID=A0A139AEE7_GONPJ|nr:Bromodomain-domain-containing protein [Gonapodya prolifera JEL478]|eukprot:KXS15137.1 Bromodomain-domain-containing protein [Gonapodya prolifera JEL478]